jgi:hypothetical protein
VRDDLNSKTTWKQYYSNLSTDAQSRCLGSQKLLQTMLEVHQTPSKLAHAHVETLAKSIKLTKTSPETQTKQQIHSQNNPAGKFLLPGGGTKRPLSLHSSPEVKKQSS